MKRALAVGFTALVALAALPACQRTAPIAVAPHTVPPKNLRLAEQPLDARRIKGAGFFGHSVLMAVEAGIAGDRVSALLELPKTSCAIVIARGSQTIEDLDLLAYGEDGTPLGSDEASDREPSLLICPPHPGRILVAARIAQGHGVVAVGSEAIAPTQATEAAQRYGVKAREAGEAARLKAWPGLDALIARERQRIGGRFQDLRRVALALDASVPTSLPASIDAGRCVQGLFIPSDDVSHLDVTALDDQGRILGRAVGSGRQRAIVVCSPVQSDITFEIRPHAGRGLAVAALARSVAGSEGEIAGEVVRRDVYASGNLKSELAALDARLKRLGYTPLAPVAQVDLGVGRHSSTPLTLGAGCTRLDVVGAAPLRGVDARLWSDGGQLRGAGTAGSGVTLFACGAGKLRLDLAAELSAGPVAVVTQREQDAPAELARFPLAGGRLVGRMVSRGVLSRANAIGKVSTLSLSSSQLATFPVLVPLDRCVDVDVAIEGAAAGLELRALDADNELELELDASVGDAAVSSRLCAFGRPGSLNARIELRSLGGAANALVATRLLTPAE